MSIRTDLVYALGSDIARSIHGLSDAHGATPNELIAAHASALIGLAYQYSADKEQFERLTGSIAASIMRAACDPNTVKINLDAPVTQ